MHSITFKAALIAEAMASSGRTFAVELHELKVEALDLAIDFSSSTTVLWFTGAQSVNVAEILL